MVQGHLASMGPGASNVFIRYGGRNGDCLQVIDMRYFHIKKNQMLYLLTNLLKILK